MPAAVFLKNRKDKDIMKITKYVTVFILTVFAFTLSASALSDDDFVPVIGAPETTAVETSVNNYDSEILYEDVPLDVPTTVEDKIEIETEEPEISVPADNTIEYDEPQIEIPDTGSKNPFWAVAVCIIGMGAVFALALI